MVPAFRPSGLTFIRRFASTCQVGFPPQAVLKLGFIFRKPKLHIILPLTATGSNSLKLAGSANLLKFSSS